MSVSSHLQAEERQEGHYKLVLAQAKVPSPLPWSGETGASEWHSYLGAG